MPRLVLVVLVLAIACALIALSAMVLGRSFERLLADGNENAKGYGMQKIAFFLLLALMAYVISNGVS